MHRAVVQEGVRFFSHGQRFASYVTNVIDGESLTVALLQALPGHARCHRTGKR